MGKLQKGSRVELSRKNFEHIHLVLKEKINKYPGFIFKDQKERKALEKALDQFAFKVFATYVASMVHNEVIHTWIQYPGARMEFEF